MTEYEGEEYNLLHSLELSTYHTFHAILSGDLTNSENLYDRNILGINLREADKIYAMTGCRKLEEYLVRLALNDTVFSDLLYKCLGGRSQKAVTLVTTLRNLVKDLTVLHRVSFLMRQRYKDKVCRSQLDDHKNALSLFARQLLQIDIFGAKCIKKGTDNLANSIESLIALYCHRQAALI